MRLQLLVMVVGLALSGCATAPQNVKAVYVSPIPYRALSCAELDEEAGRLAIAMQSSYHQQDRARSNDQLGVIFIGLPVSSLAGSNVAQSIAQQKGEVAAIHSVANAKNCPNMAHVYMDQ